MNPPEPISDKPRYTIPVEAEEMYPDRTFLGAYEDADLWLFKGRWAGSLTHIVGIDSRGEWTGWAVDVWPNETRFPSRINAPKAAAAARILATLLQ